MQPYHVVLILFAICLLHAFWRVRISLQVERFLEYRKALFGFAGTVGTIAAGDFVKSLNGLAVSASGLEGCFIGIARESCEPGDIISVTIPVKEQSNDN